MSSFTRRFLFAVLLVFPLSFATQSAGAADEPKDAGDFISHLVSDALKAVADRQLTQADREKTFRQLLETDFDIPRIARFTLGRYWATASDEDRQKFISTFEDYIVRSYTARFSEYSGETVKVTSSRPESDTSIIVNSEIVHTSGEPPAKIAWRVHKDDKGFKIVDVDVEGVSMIVTQRDEFASVIQRNGGTVVGLTKAIQQKMDNGGTMDSKGG